MLRLALCDDDANFRALVRVVLAGEDDMEVVSESGDGRECVERIAATRPDAVLLDLVMPRMLGFEAIPQLTAASPETKVIVLSSQPAVDGLTGNQYQVAVFNSSDGVLSANPVVTLEDDKGLNPNDYIVPAVNSKKDTPELKQALDGISAKITQEELLRMNKETQNDRRPFDKVAEDFVG